MYLQKWTRENCFACRQRDQMFKAKSHPISLKQIAQNQKAAENFGKMLEAAMNQKVDYFSLKEKRQSL